MSERQKVNSQCVASPVINTVRNILWQYNRCGMRDRKCLWESWVVEIYDPSLMLLGNTARVSKGI